MLIADALEAAKAAGKLHPARPIESWAPQPRAFLMCNPLRDAIAAGKADSSDKVRARWASLEGAIGTFIVGGMMNENLLKQLLDYKREHWELRNRRPKPSLRVFGRFALPNVFVGTHVKPRNVLGGMWSPQFEHEKLVCEQLWVEAGLPPDNFFTDAPSFRYEAYITENASREVKIQ